MTNWMQYLLEVNIYLAIAYGCYWLLLRRQTFYGANRVYLLASALLCFTIPLVQVTFSAPTYGVVAMAQAQEVLIQSAPAATPTLHPQAVFDTFKAITAIYIAGAVLALVLLSLKLYRLLKLIFSSRRQKHEGYTLVFVPGIPSPFSFMHYLFVAGKEQLQPVILQHELVHISQKHSCDVLFAELLKIICWFNPAVYLLQNSLKALHEFEADRLTAESTEQDGYVDFLIAQACHNNGINFANHFSEKQLLKSRIMKLYQKRSGNLARLNYLMALPLCAGMLCASSVAFSKDFGLKFDLGSTSETKQKTSSDEVLFPPPVVRPADGKVSSKRTAGFESVIGPKHPALQKDSVKKLRLKVTSGNTSGITDKLKLSGAGGKELVYTAQTLTQQDQKDLKQRFGIDVETTSATGSMTNIMVLPPPPPVDPRNPKKNRYPLIPPPPPPVEKRTSAKKTTKPPPPPPVEAKLPGPDSITATTSSKYEKPVLENVIVIGDQPNTSIKPNAKLKANIISKITYIQVDKVIKLKSSSNKSIVRNKQPAYIIDGKFYSHEQVQKHSAAIMKNGKIETLLHAEKLILHDPDDKEMIAKYGEVTKNGVWEFTNIFWSKM